MTGSALLNALTARVRGCALCRATPRTTTPTDPGDHRVFVDAFRGRLHPGRP